MLASRSQQPDCLRFISGSEAQAALAVLKLPTRAERVSALASCTVAAANCATLELAMVQSSLAAVIGGESAEHFAAVSSNRQIVQWLRAHVAAKHPYHPPPITDHQPVSSLAELSLMSVERTRRFAARMGAYCVIAALGTAAVAGADPKRFGGNLQLFVELRSVKIPQSSAAARLVAQVGREFSLADANTLRNLGAALIFSGLTSSVLRARIASKLATVNDNLRSVSKIVELGEVLALA